MKKRIISLILAIIFIMPLCSSAVAIYPESSSESLTESVVSAAAVCNTSTGTAVDPELQAAQSLHALGIMNGYGTLSDGSVDYGLDNSITRQEALCLIVRALGHGAESTSINYNHPFTDVSGWASGSVGYAYLAGIANGVSSTLFNATGNVTGRDIATFILRGIGYGSSITWENSCQASDGLGITYGQFGDGTEPITRGQAAVVIDELLSHSVKGESKTILEFLLETGVVTSEQVEKAGKTSLITSTSDDVLTGQEMLSKYKSSLFTITSCDADGNTIKTGSGFFVAEGVGVTALSNLNQSLSAEIVSWTNRTYPVEKILCYDTANDLVYIAFSNMKGNSFFSKTSESEAPNNNSTVYVLASVPISGKYNSGKITAVSPAGLPAVDGVGNFLGITTSTVGTVSSVTYTDNDMTLTTLGEALWPEVFVQPEPEVNETENDRGIDPSKPMVAVTYDDGPHLTNTPALLALLEKYGVVATFFEVGSRLETMPQFLTQMEELGCEIGNHSYSHSNLTRLSSSGVYQEIEKTNALIRQEVGHDATVVRAPGGNINSTVKSAIDFPLINWSIDTQDWKYRSSSHVISVIKNAGNLDGDVILMHSLYSSTVEASETIIPWLIEQGYQLVTVSELARYRDVDLTSGSVYYSF